MGLAIIPIVVATDHLSWLRWQFVVLTLAAIAVVCLFIQSAIQSKEDSEREKKETQRDKTHTAILAQLSQITASSKLAIPAGTRVPATALLASPPVDFDAAAFLKHSHQSVVTADLEAGIRVSAHNNNAGLSPEDFYAKFIGVGIAAYLHDITWAYIWRSQFLMLIEINRTNGYMIPIAKAMEFYNEGQRLFPDNYRTYPFESWIGFCTAQSLVIRHPSDMIELTYRGRDFLIYSAHVSRTPDMKRG